jgi:cytochrome c-type biogenesis protein
MTDATLLFAIFAGLVSFLSPCVLPLVPAYLGQLTAVAAAAGTEGAGRSRWVAVRQSLAYVAGFGAVFTLLGITATFAGGVLASYMDELRVIGGVILIVMGLSLAGILRIGVLERTWRPLDAGASAGLATTTGGMALAPAGGGGGGVGGRFGNRMVEGRTGLAGAFALGAIFAVGWTPCIGVFLGGVLMMAAGVGTGGEAGRLPGAVLLFGYTLGLGIPFVLIAAFYDRSQRFMRFLNRHGRIVSLVGGLLVVAIGVMMVFNWLILLPRFFQFVSFV